MHVHTLIHSCEGFIELGHGHQNKPTHAGEIVKALWDRERGRGIERPIYTVALKQRNALFGLFHKTVDRQKSAPSRLSTQPTSKAKALSTVISFPAGSRV